MILTMNKFICWKELSFKDKLSYILCIFSFIIGVLLTIAGFVVNPLGEVDASVLTSLGLFLSFSGSIIGITQHYSMELDKFKTSIINSINTKDESINTKDESNDK